MTKALIIVDVQNDFCEGGSLAVTGGASVAERISDYLEDYQDNYDVIIATKDWHIDPKEHFASKLGQEPDYVVLWPDHCVAKTVGAEFHPLLDTEYIDEIVYKGQYTASYTGFDGETSDDRASLDLILKDKGIHLVEICGIATDFCVKATALDAKNKGYTTRVLIDLCAGVAEESSDKAKQEMLDAGITLALAGH